MSILRRGRPAGLVVGIPLVVLVVAVLVIIWGHGAGTQVAAVVPAPGLDWSMGIDVDGDTTDDCDSSAGPAKCTLGEGESFTLNIYLNSLPDGVATYSGYDGFMTYTGMTSKGNLVNVWPDCLFPAGGELPGELFPGCAIGLPPAGPSTYTGVMVTFDLNCEASGTITMIHGEFDTSLSEDVATQHAEGEGTTEALTINCGEGPPPATNTPLLPTATETPAATATPCPDGICPTATPTDTPVPATATDTPSPATATPTIAIGDVNGDGAIDSRDALWVLWDVADVVDSVPFPHAADVNVDGVINALDAALILQFEAGLIDSLPPS